jgi:hypothetical protein
LCKILPLHGVVKVVMVVRESGERWEEKKGFIALACG